ncbi:urea amidolyase [Penicillium odoratum]|uniref:urea amidolyase n=1 Tax=Penicillium odoratum TaxID=1167516 RepID=UPI0025497030|nr:urea amidolyase [Penicillium odoratum]KAJ5777834.1 urea amidolyase [Penicillium odoratum]
MDTISFYEVSEEEFDRKLAQFRAGNYRVEMEQGVFDMALHNELLRKTLGEAEGIQKNRAVSQKKMAELEDRLDEIRSSLEDPMVEAIEAAVNANVWKVLVQEGDVLQADTFTCILEALKMEINVHTEPHLAGMIVIRVLVKPGDTIESGNPVVLARKAKV